MIMTEQELKIKEIEKELTLKQKSLNDLQNEIIKLKEQIEEIRGAEVKEKIEITSDILEKAENISIEKVYYMANWNRRIYTACSRKQIKTLRELYYYYNNNSIMKLRNIGEKSASIIEKTIADMPIIIAKIEENEKNINKDNKPLKYLLSEKTVQFLAKKHINTLQELYDVAHELKYYPKEIGEEAERLLKLYI